jgi:hypothetical protein
MLKDEFDKQYASFETEDKEEAQRVANQINSQGGVINGNVREKVMVVWTGNSWTVMIESNYKFAVENEFI